MDEFSGIGRVLLLVGIVTAGIGAVLLLLGKVPVLSEWFGWIGRLPGDFIIKREHVSFYFPLATSVVVSLMLSLVWCLVSFLGKR